MYKETYWTSYGFKLGLIFTRSEMSDPVIIIWKEYPC